MVGKKERYHILPDRGGGSVMVFDSETGDVQYPACGQDLSALYHYLVGRGRKDESQKMLAESMVGGKPITKMVTFTSRAVAAGESRG